jgi:hypothetical protein
MLIYTLKLGMSDRIDTVEGALHRRGLFPDRSPYPEMGTANRGVRRGAYFARARFDSRSSARDTLG